MTGAPGWRLAVIGVGFLVAWTGSALLTRSCAGSATWTRSNFRGNRVTLVGGLVATVVLSAGGVEKALAAGRWIDAVPAEGLRRVALATALVGAAAGAVGLVDDLWGDTRAKGLRGHLGALREGRVTTGLLKVLVICAAAAGGAVLLGGGALGVQQVVDAGVIAGSANLVNLLDLRPGRALKVVIAVGLPLTFGAGAAVGLVVAWAVGVSAGLLWPDLRERSMLGDGGANALGGALGVGLAGAGGLATSSGVLLGIVVLTLLSEAVSFSAVIERTSSLRWVDQLGRAA